MYVLSHALGLTCQYSVLSFHISTVFDINPLELVRFRNSRYFVSSRSFSCPALPFLFSFSYFKCKSRKQFRSFSTVSDRFHHKWWKELSIPRGVWRNFSILWKVKNPFSFGSKQGLYKPSNCFNQSLHSITPKNNSVFFFMLTFYCHRSNRKGRRCTALIVERWNICKFRQELV
jgi:hypothetical protein